MSKYKLLLMSSLISGPFIKSFKVGNPFLNKIVFNLISYK